jgi:DNA primase
MAGHLVNFQEAKQAADVVAILNDLGLAVKIRGDEVRSDCPLCKKTKCFSANLVRKIWKCFACGQGGDVLKLVSLTKDVSVKQAAAGLIGSSNPPAKSGGYMREAGQRWDARVELRPGEDASAWKKRLKKFFLDEVLASYRNAQK